MYIITNIALSLVCLTQTDDLPKNTNPHAICGDSLEPAFHSFKGLLPNETYDKGISDEFLTVVDSETGELVWEAPWPGVKPRIMMTVGHLQGIDKPASLVVLDGTYAGDGYVLLTAINGKTGKMDWQVRQKRPAGHNLDIGDIDEDGIQEVICGGVCYTQGE